MPKSRLTWNARLSARSRCYRRRCSLPSDIARAIVAEGARLALIGAILGALGSLATGQLVAGLFFELEPTDPKTFAPVFGLVFAATFVAAHLPARRAARVDPRTALG